VGSRRRILEIRTQIQSLFLLLFGYLVPFGDGQWLFNPLNKSANEILEKPFAFPVENVQYSQYDSFPGMSHCSMRRTPGREWEKGRTFSFRK